MRNPAPEHGKALALEDMNVSAMKIPETPSSEEEIDFDVRMGVRHLHHLTGLRSPNVKTYGGFVAGGGLHEKCYYPITIREETR